MNQYEYVLKLAIMVNISLDGVGEERCSYVDLYV